MLEKFSLYDHYGQDQMK